MSNKKYELSAYDKLTIAKNKDITYELVPLSKIFFAEKLDPKGLAKIKTEGSPRLIKNQYGEYRIQDGRHRIGVNYLYYPERKEIGCFVNKVVEKGEHYSGIKVWEAVEDIGEYFKPRRSKLRSFLNFFGLFRKETNFIDINKATNKIIGGLTKRLIDKLEDELNELYKDLFIRTHTMIAYINGDLANGAKEIKIRLGNYTKVLSSLVEGEEATLNKIVKVIKEEIKRPELKDNPELTIIISKIEGDSKVSGLIKILKIQLELIRTGNLPEDTKSFEKQLIDEIIMMEKVIKEQRNQIMKELHYKTNNNY